MLNKIKTVFKINFIAIIIIFLAGCQKDTVPKFKESSIDDYKDGKLIKEINDKTTIQDYFLVNNKNFELYKPKDKCDEASIDYEPVKNKNFFLDRVDSNNSMSINIYMKEDNACKKIGQLGDLHYMSNIVVDNEKTLYFSDFDNIYKVNKNGLKKVYDSKRIGADLSMLNNIITFTKPSATNETLLTRIDINSDELDNIELDTEKSNIIRSYKNGETIDVLTNEKDKNKIIYQFKTSDIEQAKSNEVVKYTNKVIFKNIDIDESAPSASNNKVYFTGITNLICDSDYSKCRKVESEEFYSQLDDRFSTVMVETTEACETYLLDNKNNTKEKILNQCDNELITMKDDKLIVKIYSNDESKKKDHEIISYNLIK